MAQYTIGEVEDITGIKAHVLRYWEEVIPSLAPQKNVGGRRTYSSRDVQIILRLSYLINERKFTIEGARYQLIEEAAAVTSSDNTHIADSIRLLNELRADLIEIFAVVRRYRSKTAAQETAEIKKGLLEAAITIKKNTVPCSPDFSVYGTICIPQALHNSRTNHDGISPF